MDKPLVGISTCLLGNAVRYDGGHRLDRPLLDALGGRLQLVPVCPEAECGMGIPREAMRLEEIDGRIRLVTRETGRDMTGRMESWIEGKVAELRRMPLCGFVLKTGSPSCALSGVEIRGESGVNRDGTGIFAERITVVFPELPAEDEIRLAVPGVMEAFIRDVTRIHEGRRSVDG